MRLPIPQKPMTFFVMALFSFLLLQLSFHTAKAATGSTPQSAITDQLALLAFKSALSDPGGALSSWKHDSPDPCVWKGVTCGPKPARRVTALKLQSLQLEGPLSPTISSCSYLQELTLSGNRLSGEIPASFSSLPVLKMLNLGNNNLTGAIPPSLGNSTSLTYVNISGNGLSGAIPQGFANSSVLEFLDLSRNLLSGGIPVSEGSFSILYYLDFSNNRLEGSIPPALGTGVNIVTIDLSHNNLSQSIPPSLLNSSTLHYLNLAYNGLTGKIPPALQSSMALGYLDLSVNNLSGNIPSSLGNLSSLSYLYLSDNKLEGSIPESLASIPGLVELYMPTNRLSGKFPSSFYNLSSITYFGMAQNHLSGVLLPAMGLGLPMLRVLDLQENQFEGPIPPSLCNASRLEILQLAGNGFTGMIPSCLGSLQNVTEIDVGWNQLQSDDLSIVSTLTNCTLLSKLSLQKNKLQGELPASIGNFSTKLDSLWLGDNQMSGVIPAEIGHLVGLTVLFMNKNLFTGEIPSTTGNLSKLNLLDLSKNKLSGQIPFSIGNLTQLNSLFMEDNQLSGSIPSTLGVDWRYLVELNISHNALVGSIPKEIVSLSSLTRYLDLSHNSLSGFLPMEVSSLINLQALNLSYNQLSGEIPANLGYCIVLQHLKMEMNFFQGRIPKTFSNLNSMIELDLSHNNLSGRVPDFLESFSYLHYLNLSFNSFEGEVPVNGVFTNATAVSLTGNPKLCGGNPILSLQACSEEKKSSNKLKIVLPVVGGAAIILLCAFCCLIYRWKKYKMQATTPVINRHDSSLTYAEIFNATNGFSDANLIGSGSFGDVYKAKMPQIEHVLAVKVLKLNQRGALRSFVTECQVLRNVRHRNLLKIVTLCSSLDFKGDEFKALVFQYMSNGSLDGWLHSETSDRSRRLTLHQRLNISIDVASALEHLHCHSVPPILHCDLKPSNILLDSNMTAIVGDFGLAMIMTSAFSDEPVNSTSLMRLRGSVGYVAPEYGVGGQISWEGDVYSYGILLLEILTGKRPTDDSFVHGMNLHKYVETAFPEKISDVLDPQISREVEDDEADYGRSFGARMRECMASLFQIGLSCSSESPRERMEMTTVVKELNSLREMISSWQVIESR